MNVCENARMHESWLASLTSLARRSGQDSPAYMLLDLAPIHGSRSHLCHMHLEVGVGDPVLDGVLPKGSTALELQR